MDISTSPRPKFRRRRDAGIGATRRVLVWSVAFAVLAIGAGALWAWAGSSAGHSPRAGSPVARVPSGAATSSSAASAQSAAATPTAAASTPAAGLASAPVKAAKPVAKVAPKPAAKAAATHAAATVAPKHVAAPSRKSGFVVVIDAGHQARADNTPEPIGPGSKTTKPAVASGTSGVATHVDESVINLKIALRLRDVLTADGMKVIMIRTSQNVDIPNSKRAKIANAAHAGLFIRLHCDGVNSSSVHGLLTLVPARNQWTGPIVTASGRAGRDVHRAALAATGAFDRGITPRSDMSGFNWSTVPSVIVEMGVMSNPAEDRRLSTAAYEQKLASGIARGIVAFAAGK
jgi:N-acetylmuramoyl-L-alanine amidase